MLASAIIGDTVGADLDKIAPSLRRKRYIETVRQTKSRFPGEGIPTKNSSVLYHTFKFLLEKKPTAQQLKKVKPNTTEVTDENVIFGTSIALGLYCSLVELDQDNLITMINSAIVTFGISKNDCSIYYYIAITTYQLMNDGYLRPQHFNDLSRLNLVSGNLLTALSWLNVYAFCRVTYTTIPTELLVPLTYAERITIMSLYYLFQSFSGYGKKPRFAVEDFVSNTPALHQSDLLFVYSAICTASEHQYLLFTKPLQEKMRYHTELCLLMKP